jgi:hypothetical protein
MPKSREIRGACLRSERPISCRFCRSRKLRCSKDATCSNCVSCGIVCQLPVENIIRSTSTDEASSSTQPELLERIRKLEELLETQKSYTNGNVVQYPKRLPESPESSSTPYTLQTNTSRSTLSPEIEHLNDDVAWLKSIYTTYSLSVSLFNSMLRLESNSYTIGIVHSQIRSSSGFAQSSKSRRRSFISIQMRTAHLHILSHFDVSGYHSTRKLRYFSKSSLMTLTIFIISSTALRFQLYWTRFMLV